MRTLPALTAAAGAFLVTPAAATDWPVITSSYQSIEWIAGLGGESPDNGNEWNNAEGKPATEAELSEPHSAMADLAGNIYIADKNAHAIRKIAPNGILTTVAGTNVGGFDGDGPAKERRLNGPQHAYALPDGTLYILDSGNRRVRRVDADGTMTTVITDTQDLSRGLWVKRDGSLIYYATQNALKRWTPSMGNVAGNPMALGLNDCGNIDVAANGDVYVSDRGGSRVYRVAANASPFDALAPVAGTGGTTNDGPAVDGAAALSVGMSEARGVAFHPAGGYFVATHRGGDLWYVDTLGKARVFVEGNGGKAHSPTPQPVPTVDKVMGEPRSVSVALNGDIIICGNDAGYIRRIRYNPPARPLPEALDLKIENGSVTASWSVPADRWYQLESTLHPAAGPWVREEMAPSTGALMSRSGYSTAAPARFFRLTTFRSWPN